MQKQRQSKLTYSEVQIATQMKTYAALSNWFWFDFHWIFNPLYL